MQQTTISGAEALSPAIGKGGGSTEDPLHLLASAIANAAAKARLREAARVGSVPHLLKACAALAAIAQAHATLRQALQGEPDLPPQLAPLSWLAEMVKECRQRGPSGADEDPASYWSMVNEVEDLLAQVTAALADDRLQQGAGLDAVDLDDDQRRTADAEGSAEPYNRRLLQALEQSLCYIEHSEATKRQSATAQQLEGDVAVVRSSVTRVAVTHGQREVAAVNLAGVRALLTESVGMRPLDAGPQVLLEAVSMVRIGRCGTSGGDYDCIEVTLADLHLRCDLVNDRQIRLAKRLALDHGAAFVVAPDFRERVEAALNCDTPLSST